jgi:N-acetylmuramoyl-L-alanine amidase
MAAGKRKFTLVIDAGHGGHDVGAVGKFSKEKDINLRTALAFGKYVERNCSDVKVIYTRKTDVFVTLIGRAEIANKAKADLFISIHTNSLPGKKISRGLETYTLGMHRASDNLDVAKRENSVILVEKDYKKHYQGFDPNSSESYIIFEFLQDNNMSKSVELAKLVQSNVCATANRPNKGVKQAGFLVLRETSMPSCLIELGFISTSDEEKFLNNETHIDEMARGIYQAFVKYKNNYSSGSSSSTKAPVQIEEPRQQEPELEIREVVNMKPEPQQSPIPELDINQLQAAIPQVNEAQNQIRNQQPAPQRNVARQQQQPSIPQNQVQNQGVRQQQSIPQNQNIVQNQVQNQNQSQRREPELQQPQVRQLPQQQQPMPQQQPQVRQLPQQQQPMPQQQPQVHQLPQQQQPMPQQQPQVRQLPQQQQPMPQQQPQARTLPQQTQPVPQQQPQARTLPQQTQPAPQQQPQARTLPQQTQPVPQQQPQARTLPQQTQPAPQQQPQARTLPQQKQPVPQQQQHVIQQQPQQAQPNVNAPVGAPIFKVQIFISDKVLDPDDSRFKDETNVNYYKEGRVFKYTIGASADYNEISRLRREIADKFPGCFIVAFRNGEKMNINDAIIEFKTNQNK